MRQDAMNMSYSGSKRVPCHPPSMSSHLDACDPHPPPATQITRDMESHRRSPFVAVIRHSDLLPPAMYQDTLYPLDT